MAGREKKVDDDWCTGRSLWFRIRNFAGTARFHGDSRSQRHTPKALFVGKAPISGKLKQRLVNEIESITMLALAGRPTPGLADGKLIPEVLVIGLKLTAKATGIPNEVIDLIAGQRKSGIVFVCVRDVPFEGSTREECAFAVRRAIPGRAGHTPIYQVYAGDWQPAGEAQLELAGSTIDELWASLCSQTILGTPEVENLDARIICHTEIARLESEVDKLTRDHQRVKNPAQRNEIYAKLHKAKAQLAKLREA